MSVSSKDDLDAFEHEFQDIQQELWYDDLWKTFFHRLIHENTNSKYKIIDWDNFKNNSFHVCTELTCKNWEDEFRPDITLFINWLPLAFIEVKKPNNPQWIKAERDRINKRFSNKKFRKFINITQLMVFSNNMKYADETWMNDIYWDEQLYWAFYATTARNSKVKFNNFREQHYEELINHIKPVTQETIDEVLNDLNHIALKYSQEFITNFDPNSPTNRIISSLFTPFRFQFFLKYWITYVDWKDEKTGEVELQKHVMRYPQFFATRAIREKLDEWVKKWVIWHTQWSWKTALAYFDHRYLRDYYAKKQIVTKFYFIVDRLDLAKQTQREFAYRWATVNMINSKEELIKDFQDPTTKAWITIVNIQKFSEDSKVIPKNDEYNLWIQRIFFIDEAHRSYDPKGSFLANLYESDKDSIKIALTGTPLIVYNEHKNDEDWEIELSKKADRKTTTWIFWPYIHVYYYNDSIKDGYTVRLLREEIQTTYKEKLQEVLKNLNEEIKKWALEKKDILAHPKYVEPMLNYILYDFNISRIRFWDDSIWWMIVCNSSKQAKEMFRIFQEKEKTLKWALILHDEWDKTSRDEQIQAFKDWKIDFLFVYAMLLTGFDSPRLKKMYLWRKIKAHNLLQTLTRVNRPYHDFKFWYVVDFADISQQFDITNRAYFEELKREYEESEEHTDDIFRNLFMTKEEIDSQLSNIKTVLSDYSTDNKEKFSQQITEINDKTILWDIRKALTQARDLYNIARLLWHTECLEDLDIKAIAQLLREITNRIDIINSQEAIQDIDTTHLLNLAMENSIFTFSKIWENELKMVADDIEELSSRIAHALWERWNTKDESWISFMEEFRLLIQKMNIGEDISMDDMTKIRSDLEKLFDRIRAFNNTYSILSDKFWGDRKYAIIYKLLEPSWKPSQNLPLFEAMERVKSKVDSLVKSHEKMVENEWYFLQEIKPIIKQEFDKSGFKTSLDDKNKICQRLMEEYLSEYHWE